MDGKYNFEEFYQNLEDGYQIYFTYNLHLKPARLCKGYVKYK